MDFGSKNLSGGASFKIEVGNDSTSLQLHCIFSGVTGTGALKIKTNNDGGDVWATLLLSSDSNSVSLSSDSTDEFFAIDRCAVGRFVLVEASGSLTGGTIQLISNEPHT